MNSRKRSPRKKPLDYPDETEGSRLAREIRQQANQWTEAERREHLRQAMALSYGGKSRQKTTRVGHKLGA